MKKRTTRRRPAKFGGSAKVTLTALSLISFIGGWNIIARTENSAAAPNETPVQAPTGATPPTATPSPTPWPTVQPLGELPPIPTLVPTLTSAAAADGAVHDPTTAIDAAVAPVQIAPLPTLAPLPPMPQAPPPPPPPPPMPAGGWQQSGGS